MTKQSSAAYLQHRVSTLPLLRQQPCIGNLENIVLVNDYCAPAAEYTTLLPDLTIFHTRSGICTATVNNRQYKQTSGSVLMISRDQVLHEMVDPQTSWHVDYILLKGEWARAAEDALLDKGKGVLLFSPAPSPLKAAIFTLFEIELAQRDGWRWNVLAQCAQILSVTSSTPIANAEASLVDQIDDLLTTFSGGDWSVSTVARHLKLTPRQLDYRMRQFAGEPIGQWLRRRRVERAAVLLSEGLSVSETAFHLGFANPFHFSRVFKEIAGIPPSKYQLQASPLLHT